MPLPRTNKNTVTRISKIVAVQTGIPTSLIDLFLNNKNNKPIRRDILDPPPPPPPSRSSESPSSSDCGHDEAPILTPELVTGRLNGNDGVIQVGESDNGSGSKTVFGGFLKILVVVVLIASIQNLTVGISVSAFMLLFFEYVAKRVVFCSNSNVEVIKDCVWFQKFPLRIKKDCEVPEKTTIVCDDDNIVLSDLVVGAECSSTNSLSFDEIEVVETTICSDETSCVDHPKLDCVNRDKKLDCSEFDIQKGSNSDSNSNGEKVLDSGKVKGSRRDKKFKSKMKKLLPKKLKGSKKEGKEKRGNKEHEAETSIEEKSENLEIEEEEENSGSKSPPLLNIEYVTEKEVDREVNFCQEVMIVNSEERKLSRVGSSGCMILSVIALVGLVLGRFPALILMIIWCFMLKIVGRSMLPLIKSSVPNS